MFSAMCPSRPLMSAFWAGDGSVRTNLSSKPAGAARPGSWGQQRPRHSLRQLALAAAYNSNPQNVEQCQVLDGRSRLQAELQC